MRYAKGMKISKNRISAYGYMLLNTLVWGAALIIVKPVFETTTPFRFLFYRFAIASVLAIPFLIHFIRKKQLNWSIIWKVAALELIGTTLNLGILYLGVERTSAIEASLISTTSPLFLILMGMFFLKERQEKKEWLGFAFSFMGMIILALMPLITKGIFTPTLSLIGNLLIIGANIAESSYFISAKNLYKTLPKFLVASISFVVGAISFGLISLWETSWSINNLWTLTQLELSETKVLLPVVYMAVFGSIIGLTAYIKGQDKIEASEASLFRYLQPAVYLPLGVIFLKEPMYPLQIVGLILILLGVGLAEIRKR